METLSVPFNALLHKIKLIVLIGFGGKKLTIIISPS